MKCCCTEQAGSCKCFQLNYYRQQFKERKKERKKQKQKKMNTSNGLCLFILPLVFSLSFVSIKHSVQSKSTHFIVTTKSHAHMAYLTQMTDCIYKHKQKYTKNFIVFIHHFVLVCVCVPKNIVGQMFTLPCF